LKDFYEEMLAISTAIRVNPDTYIHTYMCVCVCVCVYLCVNVYITQILVQGEIKDLLLGIMDQNRSILQKWEGGHYPYEAVGVAEKATN